MAQQLRQRRTQQAAATPNASEPADPTASARKVKIDTRAGHVGITVSTSDKVFGCIVDYVDPLDEAHKAGIQPGWAIVSVDGSADSASNHKKCIDAINAASERRAVITFECMTEEEVKDAVAKRPQNKSLLFTYCLWASFGAVGMHHFYLGRDTHALAHLSSFNGFIGLGWLRDFFCIPRYVRAANDDPAYRRELEESKLAHPDQPPNTYARTVAMLVFGTCAAAILSATIPAASDAPWPVEVTRTLEYLLQILGATLAVVLLGRIPPHTCSLSRPAVRAAAALIVANGIFSSSASIWVTIGAMNGCRSARQWAPTIQRRKILRRRAALIVIGSSLTYGAMFCALYQRGSVTARTSNGEFQQVRFKDAVNHILNSPFVRKLRTNVVELVSDAWQMGWKPAFKKALQSFDLAGETHACEVLGLEPQCLESWSDVKRAHRAKVLENHPDKHTGASAEELEEVQARFREVQEAYEHLSKLHSTRKAESKAGGE